jgi:N-acetylmuramidase/Putative peptidoglycan binding domain
MDFVGKGQPLSRVGLSEALDSLGLGAGDAACIWTVVEVETSSVTQGFGFRRERRPQILFERHKFREFTDGRFNAVAPQISGPPGGYGTFASQYDRLNRALALSAEAGLGVEPALRATSWGMGQIMGFNHQVAGFESAAAMVTAMKDGEDAQLRAMCGFLIDAELVEPLANKDWVAFATGYNGKNYWQNKYDVKLAQHYERFAGGSLPSLEVRTAQAALLYLGYAPGKIDGVLGPRTRTALASFRIATGLPPRNALDGATYESLCDRAGLSR